jgi:hypothetical protein
MNSENPLRERKPAAEFLTAHGYRISENTLAKLASIGGGPLFRKWGRRPLYAESDLLAWARSRCSGPQSSTSQAA